jgi:arabinoxylan arabinofuranohydrolase
MKALKSGVKQRILFNRLFIIVSVLMISFNLYAQNPFLPPWEYIPDGEPRVFGNRVYLYGSHDNAGSTTFCDTKYVVWSAPLDDLSNWRKEGESFYSKADEKGIDDVPWSDNPLYAPDLVEKEGKYYLYVYIVGAPGCIAVSDSPGGPFKYMSKYKAPAGSPYDFGGWGQYIDPGVLVDDDGKVYIYWGYKRSYMAQLNPDNMYEILPNTYQEDIIPTQEPFKFFEGASMRKINGIYYLIYAQGSTLAYATSNLPTGPFEYGGVIIGNGNDYPGGNIHGSLAQLNGQWYIFYHRMTNNTIFSRKACAEKVTINEDGSIDEVQMTSLGFLESLDPYKEHSPYTACILKGGNYITEIDSLTHPVVNNSGGSIIGFKYFDFSTDTLTNHTVFTATFRNTSTTKGEMEIWVDSFEEGKGRKIGFIDLVKPENDPNGWYEQKCYIDTVSGVRALFFKFVTDSGSGKIGDLKSFGFQKTNDTILNPPNSRPYINSKYQRIFGNTKDSVKLRSFDLNTFFADAEDSVLTIFEITGNSNPSMLDATLNDNGVIDVVFKGITGGIAAVTIRATDSGGKSITAPIFVHYLNPNNPNKAFAQKAVASSVENDGYPVVNINDGKMSTRWASRYMDNQYVIFELDSAYLIKKILLYWETASGKDYDIEVSEDGQNWVTMASVVNGDGGTDKVVIEEDVISKFVRLNLKNRNTPWGFSLWEVQIFQDATNEAPVPQITIPDKKIEVGEKFIYTVPQNPFRDDGDLLYFTAFLKGSEHLPAWLAFNQQSLKFEGTPAAGDEGDFIIVLKATDTFGGEGTIEFGLVVENHTGLQYPEPSKTSFYPNPAKNHIYISNNDLEVEQIQVMDISGKTRIEKRIDRSGRETITELELKLPDGFYILKVSGIGGSKAHKLLIHNSN